ncbi:helix-turn-helix domain-containing protein [Mycobacterium marinum]|nr:helix-turn-helix domain-containing protein [Mycobacterium marinum]
MTAREAARFLRRDPRTIRRMIESGELAGGADPGTHRRRWYVYADQFGQPVTPPLESATELGELQAERDRLRNENADLRAELVSTKEAYRLVLASQATMREALADYQRSVDEVLTGTDRFREAATHFQNAAVGLQSSNSKLNAVLGTYSDALHQNLVPGHAGSLEVTGENP